MYYISNKNGKFEYEIKKSKFIAFLYSVSSLEDINSILETLKKDFVDSTHICYGYVLKENGIKEKAFDDKEPSSTAGKPILECIKKNNLINVLVVVVRYFGGIKLGAGGLTRAYNASAKNVIDLCKDEFIPFVEYESQQLDINYSKFEEFKNFCNKNNITIISSTFNEKVNVVIKKEKGSEFYFENYQN